VKAVREEEVKQVGFDKRSVATRLRCGRTVMITSLKFRPTAQ